MKSLPNSIEPKWVLVFVFFVSGVLIGGMISFFYAQAILPQWVKDRLSSDTYTYINPTLGIQTSANYSNFSSASKALEESATVLVANAETQKKVTSAAVYFRDLESGSSFDINGDTQFSPGLIIKIPIMIAYYKLAQQDPKILDEQVQFDGNYVSQDNFLNGTSTPLVQGQVYSVNDLIQKMINDSDETAAALLFDHINKATLNEIYTDLGIDFKEDKVNPDYITLQRYGVFFRLLYTAAYLSPEYSERALALLVQDKAGSLLEQNVPRAIPIAYRERGRTFTRDNTAVMEVYECDIVYYPNHPYLLCATAQGNALENIRALFSDIGIAAYRDVSVRYGG